MGLSRKQIAMDKGASRVGEFSLTDKRFSGIDKFMAWETPVDRCQDLYGYSYRDDAEDLATRRGVHVLDTDGHRIFMNFSLRDLTPGIVCERQIVSSIG